MSSFLYEEFMPNRYDTAKDISDRLDGTIVRYKGLPYRAKCKMGDFVEDMKIGLTKLANVPNQTVPDLTIEHDDPNLDISMLESMYFNHRSQDAFGQPKQIVLWVTSPASKTFKSGTYPSYSYSHSIDGGPNSIVPTEYVFWRQEAEDCIVGKYPTLSFSLALMSTMKREKYEVAVSQRVALRRESIGLIKVFIEGHFIGWIDPDTNVMKITNDDRRWAIQRILIPLGFKL